MPFLPYARLLRLPNVFTAFADIALGLCATVGMASPAIDGTWLARAALLFAASGCLYCAGMVWNDYFDIAEDRRDRPFRPLPSGKVSLRTAFWIGTALFAVGLGCAALSGWHDGEWQPDGAILGGCLIVAILLYDALVKRTPFGPLGMGACRFLNVLLGLSLGEIPLVLWAMPWHLAIVIDLYIVGVTWFARTEEKRSRRIELSAAGMVLLLALFVALTVPTRVPPGTSFVLFPYLLVAFGFWIGTPVVRAIQKPTPELVQAGVKRCIMGLIGLDALLATVFVGAGGLLILLLLPPALLLGKWVYST